MSDDTNPLEDAVDHALDAFLYAPIGLVFEGPALFPALVEKGRTQVKVARMMGEMAVQMGQTEMSKRVKTAQEQMRGSLAAMGLAPTPDRPGSGTTNGSRASTAANTAAAPGSDKATTRARTAGKATSRPEPEGLGIPDYDSLSASQVVSRLRGLAPEELERVKEHESATRARKTILNRITQLQKD